jgi:DNA invertase Pin-like site-specific DNA recombinase
VFTDHGVSGARASRPQLDVCLGCLRPGDTLVVCRLDRLGRSVSHLVAASAELRDCGVDFRSLTEAIDTTTAADKLAFHVFAALAEFERDHQRVEIAAERGEFAQVKRRC